MEIVSANSQRETLRADAASLGRRQEDSAAPKRDRRRTLTRIDKRGRLGRRVTELTDVFTAAVGGGLTPMRRLAVQKAAELTAIAELARGEYMRDSLLA